MFEKPVWNYLSFVAWCVVVLEVSTTTWVHCGHKAMDMQQYSGWLWHLNNAQLVLRGPKCAKKNTFTPLAAAWTADARQNGSMLPCYLCQILTLLSKGCSRNWDSSDQVTFFQSSIVRYWWVHANCNLSFLFLADRSGTYCVVFCCLSASRFVVHSEMLFIPC